MVDILGFEVPVDGAFGIGSSVLELVFWFGVGGLIGVVGLWFYFDFRTFNKKIVVFENLAGQGFQIAFKDRARIVKLGSGGEELLFLKKKKTYRTAYGKKMGANTYWFAVGQDGYWYNCVLGDIDAKMGMLDIEPIDRDMRYMHVAIRKNIEDRYRKVNFMEKYGTIAMSGLFLIIMMGGIWFLLEKIAEIASTVAGSVDASVTVQKGTQQILSSLENICSGSGIKSA